MCQGKLVLTAGKSHDWAAPFEVLLSSFFQYQKPLESSLLGKLTGWFGVGDLDQPSFPQKPRTEPNGVGRGPKNGSSLAICQRNVTTPHYVHKVEGLAPLGNGGLRSLCSGQLWFRQCRGARKGAAETFV
jgi:hypothetical protein